MNRNQFLPLICIACSVILFARFVTAKPPAISETQALEIQVKKAVEKASSCTVAILDNQSIEARVRSGTLVGPKFVVTDSSNLVGFPKSVWIKDSAGKLYKGKVVGRDWRLRLAGITLEKAVPFNLMKTRKEQTGLFAIACGRGEAPTGLPLATVGIISALSRFSGRTVQVSCDLNQSMAGGPVVDLEGQVYGVSILLPHQISRDSGVGFMVTWRILEKSIEIMKTGKNVYPASFGLLVPDRDVPGLEGVPVVEARPGGAANIAGIEKGDLLLAVGDRPLESIYDLSTRIAQLAAGDVVKIKIKKSSGAEKIVTLTTDRRDK